MSKIARVRLSLKVLARTPGYLADLTDELSRASGKTLTLEDTLDFLGLWHLQEESQLGVLMLLRI